MGHEREKEGERGVREVFNWDDLLKLVQSGMKSPCAVVKFECSKMV